MSRKNRRVITVRVMVCARVRTLAIDLSIASRAFVQSGVMVTETRCSGFSVA
jgi:hypothetical protein